ncbi:MAG: tape measure protein [Tannerella sp.]|jgi:tape measure domain-containing protein|nr:tape measure protein [Tannerella sp.]
MAGMAFHVSSDLSGLKMLEKEIERTKKAIIDLYKAGNSSDAKRMEGYLNRLMKQHSSLYESLKPVIYQYQQLERTGMSALRNLGNAANASASGFDKFQSLLLKFGAGFSLAGIIGQVVNIRGEIQQLGISFETMLGGKLEAENMMREIAEFAQKTPFTLTEVASNTKQLMAMGISSEKVMNTMKSLGDVAAGLSVPISRLAINYGQVASLGKLEQREIKDFALAGVPLVEELANMMGKTRGEIMNMVTAGSIGFPLVERAFKNMSDEGGLFYNLMEKQNASVTGQISKLKDQVQLMMNEIGSLSEGAIYGAVNLSAKLVENYKQVGETMVALASVWGVYRTVLAMTTAVESARVVILEKQLTEESLQNVSKLNLTRGTAMYTKALQSEFIAQQQRELSILRQTGMEKRRNYVLLQSQLAASRQAIIDAQTNGASAKRIAQLRRETSAIALRMRATHADMIATVQGIHAKQAEITANTGNVASTNLLTVAKNRLTAASNRLHAALMNHPYAIATAAVLALGYGMYKLVDRVTELNKASSIEKEIERSVNTEYEKSEVRIGKLVKAIEDETKSMEDRNGAIKRLKELMPDYNGMLDKEGVLVNHNKTEIDKYLVSLRQKIKLKKLESELDTLIEERAKTKANIERGESNQKNVWRKILQALAGPVGMYGGMKDASNLLFDTHDAEEYDKAIEKVMNQMEELQEAKTESPVTSIETAVDASKEVKKTLNEIERINQEIDDLRKGKTKIKIEENETAAAALQKAIDAKKEELKAQESLYESLTGKSIKKTGKDEEEKNRLKAETAERLAAIKEEQEKIRQQEMDGELALRQAKIDAMKDGFDKELALIDLNYDKRMLANAKKAREFIKKQQEIERKQWEAEHPDWKEKGETFIPAKKGIDYLTPEQQQQIAEEAAAAAAEREKSETDLLKNLADKYQDYTQKRIEIEKKYNDDLAALRELRRKAEEKGNAAQVAQLDSAIAQNTKDKGKELIGFDFNLLQKNPEYVRAFENLEDTSTQTLNELLSQLEKFKTRASEVLDPDELSEYSNRLQSIIEELNARDPFKAMTAAQKEQLRASQKLAVAQRNLTAAQKSGNPEAIVKAEEEYRDALNDVVKANNNVVKAQDEVNAKMETLYDSLRGIGDVIGGQAGEIINLIADIGSFVTTTISGLKTTATAGATMLATIEKASAILAIIQVAIQLLNQIQALLPDVHAQYEKYAAQVAEINKLTDAVNEYGIAVVKARQEMDNWFAKDGLKSLKDARELHEEVASAYFDKLREEQAVYQNESGEGWGKYVKAFTAGVTMMTFGDVTGATAVMAQSLFSSSKYAKETVEAMKNLRIETRAASKGFWGTGIGGHSQKTEDLVEWARAQGLGELFDENGMINEELAKLILEKYNDKLVGETEATLESLVDLKEQYDEYLEKLHEYVSGLYAPLIDNFVDSLWDWYDTGKDVLDSFREYASDTFRDIVSDMLRTIALDSVFGSFDEDIARLYERYSKGELNEAQLMSLIAARTAQLSGDIQTNLPVMQSVLETVIGSLNEAGINLQNIQGGFDDTFGYLEDGITDHIVNAIGTGTDAWENFKDVGIQAIEAIGKKLMNELFFAKGFKELQKKMEDLYATETDPKIISQRESELLDDYFNGLESSVENAQRWGEEWQKRMNERGYDVWDDGSASENTLSGAYAKASQESIDLLAGQTGAARRTLELILAELHRLITLPRDLINSVMGGLNAIPELIARGYAELVAIKELNARMASSNDAIAANTQRIGEIAGQVVIIRDAVSGNTEILQSMDTAITGDVAGNTAAAANSLHKIEQGVNVNMKGL